MYIYELFMNLDIEIDGYVIYKKKKLPKHQETGPTKRALFKKS